MDKTAHTPRLAACASAFLLVLGSPALAQTSEPAEAAPPLPILGTSSSMAPKTSGATAPPVSNTNATAPSQSAAQSFEALINTCFTMQSDLALSTRATAGFSLGSDGQLAGIPEWLGQNAASAEERKLFLAALVALESCAPYVNAAPEGSYTAIITPLGVEKVMQRDTSSASVTPPPAPEGGTVTPKPPTSGVAPPPTDTASNIPPPATPAYDWQAADAATEKALGLKKPDIAAIQARLQAMGFDPNGIDGMLGKGTRKAIGDWQVRADIPQTGYLNEPQHARLMAESQPAFDQWLADPNNQAVFERASRARKKVKVRVCRPALGGLTRVCKWEWRYR